MGLRYCHWKQNGRRGVAAVEMAALAPLLFFLMIITIDFARVFYFSLVMANCARNGALWESDPYVRGESPYRTLEEAALADAFNLFDEDNLPTVTSTAGQDGTDRNYVEVTVTYQFRLISSFPGIPNQTRVSRSVSMAVAPPIPDL